MADLVRKTQFEKICPFSVLDEVMLKLKELQALYEDENGFLASRKLAIMASDSFPTCTDKEDAIFAAASMLFYLIEIKKARDIKPDS